MISRKERNEYHDFSAKEGVGFHGICWECKEKIAPRASFYTLSAVMYSKDNWAPTYVPGGNSDGIRFCEPCWQLIAGPKYSFSID